MLPVYSRRITWFIRQELYFFKSGLKLQSRRYRVVDFKFGSFINFIYKNLFRYIRLYRKKMRRLMFNRYKYASIKRRTNKKIILPKPIITRRRRSYCLAENFII